MIEFLQGLNWWQWIVFALVLGALETFMPGAVAIWFAASAAIIGLLLVVVPLPWQYFPWLVLTLFSYCLVAQGMKRLYIRRFGQWF